MTTILEESNVIKALRKTWSALCRGMLLAFCVEDTDETEVTSRVSGSTAVRVSGSTAARMSRSTAARMIGSVTSRVSGRVSGYLSKIAQAIHNTTAQAIRDTDFTAGREFAADIFNKSLFRAVIGLFAIGMVVVPFIAISESDVNIPDRSTFLRWSEPYEKFLNTQDVNTLESRYVTAEELGIPVSLVENPKTNRDHVWNYLLEAGFTDEQAAGIMGNLQQEHGYQTSGDGLAQWMGGRRARLMSMKDPFSLQTQLDFLVKVELAGSYSHVRTLLEKCTTVEAATRVFCDRYERPGIPAMSKRIAYAHNVYATYHKEESSIPPVLVVEGSADGQ